MMLLLRKEELTDKKKLFACYFGSRFSGSWLMFYFVTQKTRMALGGHDWDDVLHKQRDLKQRSIRTNKTLYDLLTRMCRKSINVFFFFWFQF